MPAIKCDNGKWKWGETGSCKYETQVEAETDNEDYYEEKNNNELEKGKEKTNETIKEGEKLGENIKIWDKKYNNEKYFILSKDLKDNSLTQLEVET